jgi:hypothetical protein
MEGGIKRKNYKKNRSNYPKKYRDNYYAKESLRYSIKSEYGYKDSLYESNNYSNYDNYNYKINKYSNQSEFKVLTDNQNGFYELESAVKVGDTMCKDENNACQPLLSSCNDLKTETDIPSLQQQLISDNSKNLTNLPEQHNDSNTNSDVNTISTESTVQTDASSINLTSIKNNKTDINKEVKLDSNNKSPKMKIYRCSIDEPNSTSSNRLSFDIIEKVKSLFSLELSFSKSLFDDKNLKYASKTNSTNSVEKYNLCYSYINDDKSLVYFLLNESCISEDAVFLQHCYPIVPKYSNSDNILNRVLKEYEELCKSEKWRDKNLGTGEIFEIIVKANLSDFKPSKIEEITYKKKVQTPDFLLGLVERDSFLSSLVNIFGEDYVYYNYDMIPKHFFSLLECKVQPRKKAINAAMFQINSYYAKIKEDISFKNEFFGVIVVNTDTFNINNVEIDWSSFIVVHCQSSVFVNDLFRKMISNDQEIKIMKEENKTMKEENKIMKEENNIMKEGFKLLCNSVINSKANKEQVSNEANLSDDEINNQKLRELMSKLS